MGQDFWTYSRYVRGLYLFLSTGGLRFWIQIGIVQREINSRELFLLTLRFMGALYAPHLLWFLPFTQNIFRQPIPENY